MVLGEILRAAIVIVPVLPSLRLLGDLLSRDGMPAVTTNNQATSIGQFVLAIDLMP